MSGYAHTNLMELENAAEKRMPGSGIVAHIARHELESEHLGVSYFHYPPSFRSPVGHRHREQEEAYVVVQGAGRAKLGDEVVDLRQWDVLRVAPEVVRAFEGGPEGLGLIAIGADLPEGGDGEMVPDFWAE